MTSHDDAKIKNTYMIDDITDYVIKTFKSGRPQYLDAQPQDQSSNSSCSDCTTQMPKGYIHEDDVVFDANFNISLEAIANGKTSTPAISVTPSLDGITNVSHEIVLNAILALWYPLYCPSPPGNRFAVCTLKSPWDLIQKKTQYFIGHSNRLIVPFRIGPEDVTGEKNDGTIIGGADHPASPRSLDNHTILAIATKRPRRGNIELSIFDTDSKHKKRDQVLHCVRKIIALSGWAKQCNTHRSGRIHYGQHKSGYLDSKRKVRFESRTAWISVTQRTAELNSCPLDTILYAWAQLLNLDIQTRKPGKFFGRAGYEKAREMINLALRGKLHTMTAATGLVSLEFVKRVPDHRTWSNLQSVAMNESVLEDIALDIHGPPSMTPTAQNTSEQQEFSTLITAQHPFRVPVAFSSGPAQSHKHTRSVSLTSLAATAHYHSYYNTPSGAQEEIGGAQTGGAPNEIEDQIDDSLDDADEERNEDDEEASAGVWSPQRRPNDLKSMLSMKQQQKGDVGAMETMDLTVDDVEATGGRHLKRKRITKKGIARKVKRRAENKAGLNDLLLLGNDSDSD